MRETISFADTRFQYANQTATNDIPLGKTEFPALLTRRVRFPNSTALQNGYLIPRFRGRSRTGKNGNIFSKNKPHLTISGYTLVELPHPKNMAAAVPYEGRRRTTEGDAVNSRRD
jgi:hypothetical protein